MLVIHGTLKSEEKLRIVNEMICPFCKQSDRYTITIKETWITLYFIPIFPSRKYIKCCEECRNEEFIHRKELTIYQKILDLSLNKRVDDDEKKERQALLEEKLRGIYEVKLSKLKSEKNRYIHSVRNMSNHDLIERFKNPNGFSEAFLSVVQDEMIARKLK
jgi:hypothetical protein